MTTLSAALPQAPPAPVAAQARSPFIVSPWFDGFFFFASVLTVVAAWQASASFGVGGYYILAAVAVVSNGPHLVSTWTRVYMDRREWKRPVHVFVVPALIVAAVVALFVTAGVKGHRIVNTVLLYWAVWHFVAQNWGLLRIYQKRSGEPDSAWALKLERPMLYTFVAWCLLHRVQTGPRRIFGTELYYPKLPLHEVDLLLYASILMAAAWLFLRLREGRTAWTASAWLRGGFLACAGVGFFVPFLLITTDDTTGFAAAACWHGLQYIGIVHFYHRNAWKDGVHPEAKVISWISQPGKLRLLFYVALLLGLAGSGFVIIHAGAWLTAGTRWTVYMWGSLVWLSFTFSHYYLDGVIWKLSRDRKVAERLAVAPVS